MKHLNKNIVFILALFLFGQTLAQITESTEIKYKNKNLTFSTTLKQFQKKFKDATLVEQSTDKHKIYGLEAGDFKVHFINDTLSGLEIDCYECYSEKIAYNIIGNQFKKIMKSILPSTSNKLRLFYVENYIALEDQYYGEESGDLSISFNIINLDQFKELVELLYLWNGEDEIGWLFEVSNLIFREGNRDDYLKVSPYIEELALQKLEKDPNDMQSYYNAYRILLEIYENTKDYKKSLGLWQKLEIIYPEDKQIKLKIKEYEQLVEIAPIEE